MRIIILAFLATMGLLLGCDEQELKSTCAPDGPCEAFLLLQCDCCSEDLIEACREDRRTACATGRLQLTQSVEECQASVDDVMQLQSAGTDYCQGFDSDQLASSCSEQILVPDAGAANAMTPAAP